MCAQSLQQVQKQSLTMAPQMRQSLKILQVNALDLRNTILEELQANPALEELSNEATSIDETGNNLIESTPDNLNESSSEPTADLQTKELNFDGEFEAFAQINEEWNDDYSDRNFKNSYTSDDAERRQHFFESITIETSLQEHLVNQIELSDVSDEMLEALNFLVGSLNDNGFLVGTLEEIAESSKLPLATIQEAHIMLKTFEPRGIGCFGLKECLITQLELKKNPCPLAVEIILNHYDLLLRRRIPEIAKNLDVSIDKVEETIEVISTLDPAPGRQFSEDNNRVVLPDVKVEKDGDNWIVILNNDYIPRLRISNTYKNMIAKGGLSNNEKNYILKKFRDGKFLISAIEQRQQTIERITRILLDFQKDFFENGVKKMHPLTMNQVANVLEVHETTVSRAIANKYIDTPHGVFEFKYFFTQGFVSEDGEAVSNTSIKSQIAKIIEDENPAKPLSDNAIVNILAEKDIKIARRTIAKYREMMGILPTNLRRRYN